MIGEHVDGGVRHPHVGLSGEIIPVGINHFALVIDVGFLDRVAVEVELLVDQPDAVAGHADAALDEGLLNIDRVAEDDDVAAFGLAYRAG